MIERCVCGVVHSSNNCPVLARAVKLFGDGAMIGKNAQYPDAPLFVGKRVNSVHTSYALFGAGRTFDEAFANVRKVKFQKPNGQFIFEEEKKP